MSTAHTPAQANPGARARTAPAAGGVLALALALLAGPAAFTLAGSAQAAGPSVHGKRLLQTYDMPTEVLVKMGRFQAKAARSGDRSMLAESMDWSTPELDLPSSGNPYTLVLKVSGVAVDGGDLDMVWDGGWNLEGVQQTQRLPLLEARGLKPGQVFQGEAASRPVTFSQDRQRQVTVGLVQARNIKIDGVQVEVWSGVGNARGLERFFPWVGALTGLVFLGLVVRWRWR